MTPLLYVISRPTLAAGAVEFLNTNKLEWIQNLLPTDGEKIVEFAGRICYMSFSAKQHRKDHRTYIENLITQGHESVLEHVSWTFLIVDVSRAFTHQFVRHRAGFSFSQLSQQYHDERDAEFLMPNGIERSEVAKKAWKNAMEVARSAYKTIQTELEGPSNREALRSARSAARSVLPNATRTMIVVTANARAYRHFLEVRGAIEGDEEMRQVAFLIYEAINQDAPALLDDFVATQLPDGSPIVSKKNLSAS